MILPNIKTIVCVKGTGDALLRMGAALVLRALRPCLFVGAAFLLGESRKRMGSMETRVAVISMIVERADTVEALNGILHQYGAYIIGRMGIPYRARGINIISIAIDAPQDTISTLAGRIGGLPGVSVKTAFSNQKGA